MGAEQLGDGGLRQVAAADLPFELLLCATPECFVVLRDSTTGRPLSEDGLRKIFRVHRARSGAVRVRPHRLRHTYGTELAAAGIDLLVLRELMGHSHPETTAAYATSFVRMSRCSSTRCRIWSWLRVSGLRRAGRRDRAGEPDVVLTDIRMPPTYTDEGLVT